MATTTTASHAPVDAIRVRPGFNVRTVTDEDVQDLAESMRTIGCLTPLVVDVEEDGTYLLRAGHRRLHAAKLAGLTEVPITARGDEWNAAVDAATENLARQQLTPVQEAHAIRAVLDGGLSREGAATALGISARRVTDRLALLDLPPKAHDLLNDGLPVSAAPVLLGMPDTLRDVVIDYLAASDPRVRAAFPAARRDIVGDAARESPHTQILGAWDLTAPAVFSDAALVERASVLGPRWDQWRLSITTEIVDAARAAGVLWEDNSIEGAPLRVVCSMGWLEVQALAQLEADEAEAAAAQANEAPAEATDGAQREPTPSEAVVDRAKAERELRPAVNAANLALGAALLQKAASMDLDKHAAALLGALAVNGRTTLYELAVRGALYCIPELQTDETRARRDGTPGAFRVTFDHAAADKWAAAFLARPKTPADTVGRVVVLHIMARYALQEVQARSSRQPDVWLPAAATEALDRIAKPLLPAAYKTTLRKLREATS